VNGSRGDFRLGDLPPNARGKIADSLPYRLALEYALIGTIARRFSDLSGGKD